MAVKVDVVFDEAAMGEAFLRNGLTQTVVMSAAGDIASRAGDSVRVHPFTSSQGRPMAAVWTNAKTPEEAQAARLALEGAL